MTAILRNKKKKKKNKIIYSQHKDDDLIIEVGIYKDRSYKYVFENQKNYCNWVNNNNPINLANFTLYLREKSKIYFKKNILNMINKRYSYA